MITFLAPLVAKFALKFGPPEFFAVYLLTFCSFVGMGKGSPFKILASMTLGFALASVGMDTVTGQLRLTFGWTELMRGFDFLIAVIGLFGIGEILLSMEEGLAFSGKHAKLDPKVVLATWKKLPQYWMTSVRSSLVGIWMGITPGGATPASFMSYGLAKKMSKTVNKFGTGEIEGVIAPETAAHAAGTSALLPMLALGIPGSPTAAVLLGGLLIWGLQPGPLLFVEQKDFVWGLIASMYLGNLVGLLVVLSTVPLFASILRIPFSIIAPVIIVICAIGAYTVHSAMLDIWFMLIFGVMGYMFKKLDYPLAPLVLALVLGDKAEDSFRQSMLLSQGELGIMYSNYLVGSITTHGLVYVFMISFADLFFAISLVIVLDVFGDLATGLFGFLVFVLVRFFVDDLLLLHEVFVDLAAFFHDDVMEQLTSLGVFIVDHIFDQLLKLVHMVTPIGKVYDYLHFRSRLCGLPGRNGAESQIFVMF